MNERLESAQNQIEADQPMKFEADVDRAIFEVYGKNGLEEFNDMYRAHPEWTLEEVLKHFEERPVNTQTSFFRNPNLKVIAEQLIPKVGPEGESQQGRILEIGCSSGEESYSLAVTMLEAGHDDFHITAVDVNPDTLKIAEQAEYKIRGSIENIDNGYSSLKSRHFTEGFFEDTGKKWQRREYIGPSTADLKDMGYFGESGKKVKDMPAEWFEMVGEPLIRPAQKVREHIEFKPHDLIEGPVSGEYSVVLMNNVLLHYPAETREKILQNALASLRPGGYLVLEFPMHPLNKNEESWLNPYRKWREEFAEKFHLHEVPIKRWNGEQEKVQQYYRYDGRA
jgi:chemotaxis methyl-accepting protein methylase